jgi:hypothetical protein
MKRVVRILGIAAVLLLVIAFTVPFFIDANQFRPALESRLSVRRQEEAALISVRST